MNFERAFPGARASCAASVNAEEEGDWIPADLGWSFGFRDGAGAEPQPFPAAREIVAEPASDAAAAVEVEAPSDRAAPPAVIVLPPPPPDPLSPALEPLARLSHGANEITVDRARLTAWAERLRERWTEPERVEVAECEIERREPPRAPEQFGNPAPVAVPRDKAPPLDREPLDLATLPPNRVELNELDPQPIGPRPRRIPESAVLSVSAKPKRAPEPPGAAPAVGGEAASSLEVRQGRAAQAYRITLLVLAGLIAASGIAHSLIRAKPTPAIVVPASTNERTVIT